GEPGATTTAKGTVSKKPRSTAKRSRKQPVATTSTTPRSSAKRKPTTNKQQLSSPPSKRSRKAT
ncbi:hypothetical protein GGH94_003864, partial [Coemansia aciculifera]